MSDIASASVTPTTTPRHIMAGHAQELPQFSAFDSPQDTALQPEAAQEADASAKVFANEAASLLYSASLPSASVNMKLPAFEASGDKPSTPNTPQPPKFNLDENPTTELIRDTLSRLAPADLLIFATSAADVLTRLVKHFSPTPPEVGSSSSHFGTAALSTSAIEVAGKASPPPVAQPLSMDRSMTSMSDQGISPKFGFNKFGSGFGSMNNISATSMPMYRQPTRITTSVSRDMTSDGFKTVNGYMILDELGRGRFGKVKLAADMEHNDHLVAIKVISRELVQKRFLQESSPKTPAVGALRPRRASKFDVTLLQEVAIMKKLKHRNIVRLFEVIDDPDSSKLYLVMQYIERGPLLRFDERNRCSPVDLDVARNYMRQLCSALFYLQSKNIAHRDIKPENILLGDNGRVYLADFGVSSLLNQEEAEDKPNNVEGAEGTLAFMAPEIVNGESEYDGAAADVWSLGVTFFAMVHGRLPFVGDSVQELRKSIIMGESGYFNDSPDGNDEPDAFLNNESFAALFNEDLKDADAKGVTRRDARRQQFDDLIDSMLTTDPSKRITLSEASEHPFFHSLTTVSGTATPAQRASIQQSAHHSPVFGHAPSPPSTLPQPPSPHAGASPKTPPSEESAGFSRGSTMPMLRQGSIRRGLPPTGPSALRRTSSMAGKPIEVSSSDINFAMTAISETNTEKDTAERVFRRLSVAKPFLGRF